MDKMEKLENLLDITGNGGKKVKIEKKDKGLIERREKDVVLITEDNKLILTD